MYKNYTIDEIIGLIGKAISNGYTPVFCGNVTVSNTVSNGLDTIEHDVSLEIYKVDSHNLCGYFGRKASLDDYKEFICIDYGDDKSDVIYFWSEEEIAKEEQYARPDYIYFTKTIPIHKLENFSNDSQQ